MHMCGYGMVYVCVCIRDGVCVLSEWSSVWLHMCTYGVLCGCHLAASVFVLLLCCSLAVFTR